MPPCGVYSRNYAEDMAIVRTPFQWGILIVLLLLLALFPSFATYYWLTLMIFMCIFVINTLGLHILLGLAGQISLGHSAFMGVGAYTSAILTAKAGIPFLVALPLSGIVTGLVGLIFGFPSVRVKGFYLALVTLGAQFILVYVFEHLEITGGTNGMTCPFASIGPLVLDTPAKIYWLTMAVTGVMIFFTLNLTRTRVGRALIAVRDNDLAAEVLGVDVVYYKLLAFFIGCFFTGIAGSLWAHYLTSVHPDQFPLYNSILYLGAIIVGGIGTLFGAITGAIVMRGFDEAIRIATPALADLFPTLGANIAPAVGPMVYGLVIMIFLIFEPRGLHHAWERLKSSIRLWPFAY